MQLGSVDFCCFVMWHQLEFSHNSGKHECFISRSMMNIKVGM